MLLSINIFAFFATLVGGMFPLTQHLLSRKGMWRIFALRSGILLSVTFTEILPAAISHQPLVAGWGALFAFVLFFFAGNFSMVDTCPEYLEECPIHFLGWTALMVLAAHSFIDGINLTVSFSAGSLAGAAVGFALTLHKLADGFTMTSLCKQGGFSGRKTILGLLLVAVATPLGSLIGITGISQINPMLSATLLGFAGGSFLYIGAMDILPRLHKTDDRASLAYFGAGMAAIAMIQGITGG